MLHGLGSPKGKGKGQMEKYGRYLIMENNTDRHGRIHKGKAQKAQRGKGKGEGCQGLPVLLVVGSSRHGLVVAGRDRQQAGRHYTRPWAKGVTGMGHVQFLQGKHKVGKARKNNKLVGQQSQPWAPTESERGRKDNKLN